MNPHSDEKIVDSWEKNATQWTSAVRGGRIESRKLITDKAIVEAVLSHSPASVLDIGCGEGWLIRELSPQVSHLVGVDAASKPLVLEVRYCECQATKTDSVPSDLLPSFLKESSLLKVSVSSEEKGFVSSSELSIGFALKPVAGSPDQFQLNYAGNYTTNIGNKAGSGKLLLVQGQWVNLFGSRHDNETGPQHSNVAVRLAKPGGS
jgi:SAM-dependent methyltransferase